MTTNEEAQAPVPALTTQLSAAPARGLLVDEVYARLLHQLVRLEVAPGEPLDEKRIAAEFGVGRQPVRAALSRLETDGLVAVYPRRGTFASAVHLEDLGSITEVRIELEGLAARLAAQRASVQQREHLVELAEKSLATTTLSDEVDGDAAVHRQMFAMSRNRHLAVTLEHYFNHGLRMWYLATERIARGWDSSYHVNHLDLANAISNGDGDRAASLIRAHVAHDSQLVRNILDPG